METSRPTWPAAVVTGVIGALLTGLCLVTADRLARSGAAQVLAVVAVCAALTGVLVAVAGDLSATRRLVLAGAALSMVAVVLAGTAAVVVVRLPVARERPAAPAVSAQLTGAVEARVLSVQFSASGVAAGSVADTKLIGAHPEAGDEGEVRDVRSLLARSVVTAGADGLIVAQLSAPVGDQPTVTMVATLPGRRCTQALPVADADSVLPQLTCAPV